MTSNEILVLALAGAIVVFYLAMVIITRRRKK